MGSPSWYRRKPVWAGGAIAIAAIGTAIALQSPERVVAQTGSFLRDGDAGFVVTKFTYALGPDNKQTGACTGGMSKNVVEIFGESPEGHRRPGEDDETYSKRLEEGGKSISVTADGKNFCMNPELAPFDTHTRTLTSASVPADGMNLDGKVSRSADDARSGRLDFTGTDGTKGVDNQFWRAVGCSKSFQSDGPSNGFDVEMYTGSWGILIDLKDVDDLKSDGRVKVGIYANSDPLRLSPTRAALDYATYAKDSDPAFRADTTGKIENGVLTTEPVNVRLHSVVNGMYLERTLRNARIRATLLPDGTLKGYLGGYAPVPELYDLQFGYRNGKDAKGQPSPLARRLGSSNGAARVLGHTCQGIYQSLNHLADGDPDPKTGKFTSISMQYRFEARPAFIVDGQPLDKTDKVASK